MNIKTFRYLLDGFIQEDYEYYNKPYVISPNYLGFNEQNASKIKLIRLESKI
jgi:hypothetical protein